MTIKLSVQYLSGRSCQIDVAPETSVSEVCARFEGLFDRVDLLVGGHRLPEDALIKEVEAISGSTLQIVSTVDFHKVMGELRYISTVDFQKVMGELVNESSGQAYKKLSDRIKTRIRPAVDLLDQLDGIDAESSNYLLEMCGYHEWTMTYSSLMMWHASELPELKGSLVQLAIDACMACAKALGRSSVDPAQLAKELLAASDKFHARSGDEHLEATIPVLALGLVDSRDGDAMLGQSMRPVAEFVAWAVEPEGYRGTKIGLRRQVLRVLPVELFNSASGVACHLLGKFGDSSTETRFTRFGPERKTVLHALQALEQDDHSDASTRAAAAEAAAQINARLGMAPTPRSRKRKASSMT